MQTFYQDITRDVYTLRLRGAENLEEYHLERGMEEMKKLAKDKQNLPELHKRKNDGDDEVELAHKRQKSEREEQVRATQSSNQLTPVKGCSEIDSQRRQNSGQISVERIL